MILILGSTLLMSSSISYSAPISSPLFVKDRTMVDNKGREVKLRGVNARIEGLFDVSFDDGRPDLEPVPAFDIKDAQLMVDLGYNFIRIPINWSGLQPLDPKIHGVVFAENYIKRLHEVVQDCTAAGLWVVIDFHQDAFSKEIGEDGAPAWALVPQPAEWRINKDPLKPKELLKLRALSLPWYKSFFRNEEGVLDKFWPAWRKIVQEFSAYEGVIGFEPMNEPVAIHFRDGLSYLQSFYQQAADEMKALGVQKPLWIDPDASRNFIGRTISPERYIIDFEQIVYTPHFYPLENGLRNKTVKELKDKHHQSIDRMITEAEVMNAALVIGEWGFKADDPAVTNYGIAVEEMFNERNLSHAYWLWKEDSQGAWGFFDFNEENQKWVIRPRAIETLSRPYPQFIPGRLIQHRDDRSKGLLSLTYEASEASALLPLEIYLPTQFTKKSIMVYVNGKESKIYRLDGQTLTILIADTGTINVKVSL